MAKPENIYAFIDAENLHIGVKQNLKDKNGKLIYQGWELDYRKFRLYVKNKYNVTRTYLFIGNVPGKESLYRALQEMGYILVLKLGCENNRVNDECYTTIVAWARNFKRLIKRASTPYPKEQDPQRANN